MSNVSSCIGSPENMTRVGALHAVTFRYECIGLMTDHMNLMTRKIQVFFKHVVLLDMRGDLNIPWQKT